MKVSLASTSVVESEPTTVPMTAFSATVAAESATSLGPSLTFVTPRVKSAVTGVLPSTESSATLTVTA